MSFWTDINFVRPARPPRITAGDLFRFADRIAGTALVTDPRLRTIKLKFGRRIDQDRRDTSDDERVLANVFRSREIAWDVAVDSFEESDAARASLTTSTRSVYRAFLGFDFGTLNSDISRELQTARPDGSGQNLALFDVSIEVNVIRGNSLGGDGSVQVGWIAVGFGGNGYLWPWTPNDVRQRIAASPTLRAVEAACRDSFPTPSKPPLSRRWNPLRRIAAHRARRALGDFWPFEHGFPNEWAWAINETG